MTEKEYIKKGMDHFLDWLHAKDPESALLFVREASVRDINPLYVEQFEALQSVARQSQTHGLSDSFRYAVQSECDRLVRAMVEFSNLQQEAHVND